MRICLRLFSVTLLYGVLGSCSAQTTELIASPPAAEATTTVDGAVDSLRWFTGLPDARREAQVSGATILTVFAGSDWCRPCKQFRVSVLEDSTFVSEFSDDVVVLYLDFPSKRRNQLPPEQTAANEALAERYNPNGVFPTLLLLDSQSDDPIGELTYRGEDATEFGAQLREVQAAKSRG